MKYAIVNGERQEAQPGLSGKCICCNNTVIAKCGSVRVWHWAHRGICDPWWEGETEWHRRWKNLFPKEWQEVVQFAEDGEKHVADVKTDQNYVIEFQHSYITSTEQRSREYFYKKMIWIVDGVRRLRDKKKFIEMWEQSSSIDPKVDARRFWGYFDECALLRDWHDSNVPVFFDFGEDSLWGFLPKIEGTLYVLRIARNELVSFLLPASQISLEGLLKSIKDFSVAKHASLKIRSSMQPQYINYSRPRQRSRRL